MGSPKYLLRVLSKPIKTNDEEWTKWYIDEHVPDIVGYGVTERGALFRAHNDFSLKTKTPIDTGKTDLHDVQLSHFNEGPADKTFCAIYPTKFEDYTQSEEIKKVRSTADMWGGVPYHPMAEWDVRVYELIQNYDPDSLGDDIAPYSLHVQNEPADAAEYHDFYENEHLGLLHKVPGYRKSQRYQLAKTLLGAPEGVPKFMVIHEFDHLDALDGPELQHADASPNTHRVFGNAKSVNVRGFKRVYSMGYSNS